MVTASIVFLWFNYHQFVSQFEVCQQNYYSFESLGGWVHLLIWIRKGLSFVIGDKLDLRFKVYNFQLRSYLYLFQQSRPQVLWNYFWFWNCLDFYLFEYVWVEACWIIERNLSWKYCFYHGGDYHQILYLQNWCLAWVTSEIKKGEVVWWILYIFDWPF